MNAALGVRITTASSRVPQEAVTLARCVCCPEHLFWRRDGSAEVCDACREKWWHAYSGSTPSGDLAKRRLTSWLACART